MSIVGTWDRDPASGQGMARLTWRYLRWPPRAGRTGYAVKMRMGNSTIYSPPEPSPIFQYPSRALGRFQGLGTNLLVALTSAVPSRSGRPSQALAAG